MTAAEIAARIMPERAATARAARTSGLALAGLRDLLIVSAPVLFQAAMVLAQSSQPGYNPLRDTISSMVWGPQGWLQTVNLMLFGALMMGLAWQLRPLLAGSAWARLGGLLLLLVGAEFIILGICPTQSPGGAKDAAAVIHGLTVYFVVFSFPAACFLMAKALRVGKLSGFIFPYTIATGIFGTGLMVLGVFLMVRNAHWFGMLERVLLLNGFIWIEVVAVYFVGDGFLKRLRALRSAEVGTNEG